MRKVLSMYYEEVMDPIDADIAIVISENWGYKRPILKVYFRKDSLNEDGMLSLKDCLSYVAENYGDYVAENNRIDIYRVSFGHIVGRE